MKGINSTMSLDEKAEALFGLMRQKCQGRNWFGADEWMDAGFSKRPPFERDFPPRSTHEELEAIEEQLGFSLPSLLRNLYLHLANGDICFGYGILTSENVLQEYRSIRDQTCFAGAWHWPEQLIPLCYWGCTMYSYLDVKLGTILFADTDELFDGEGYFLVEAPSLTIWLERWLAKPDRYPSLPRQAEVDSVGKEALEDFDDEEDLQARAMGLAAMQDDPHTPVPSYVKEYRNLCGP